MWEYFPSNAFPVPSFTCNYATWARRAIKLRKKNKNTKQQQGKKKTLRETNEKVLVICKSLFFLINTFCAFHDRMTLIFMLFDSARFIISTCATYRWFQLLFLCALIVYFSLLQLPGVHIPHSKNSTNYGELILRAPQDSHFHPWPMTLICFALQLE